MPARTPHSLLDAAAAYFGFSPRRNKYALTWHVQPDQGELDFWRRTNPSGTYEHTHHIGGHTITHTHADGDRDHTHDWAALLAHHNVTA